MRKMADKFQDRRNKLNLSKQELEFFKQLTAQAEELGLTIRQIELLVHAVQVSAVETATELGEITRAMADGGKDAKEIAEALEAKIADVVDAAAEMDENLTAAMEIYDDLSDSVDDSIDALKEVEITSNAIESSMAGVKDQVSLATEAAEDFNEQVGATRSLMEPFNKLQEKVQTSISKTGYIIDDISGIIGDITADLT